GTTLSHVGHRGEDLDPAVLEQPRADRRAHPPFAVAGEAGAVKVERQADAAPGAFGRPGAGRLGLVPAAAKPGAPLHFLETLPRRSGGVERLSGGQAVA